VESYENWEAVVGSYRARAVRTRDDVADCAKLLQFEMRDPHTHERWQIVLKTLHAEQAMYGAIVEPVTGNPRPPVGCGLGFFLSEELLSTLTECPGALLDQTFGEYALHEENGVLRPKKIGEANATIGLHMFGTVAFDDRVRKTEHQNSAWQALARVGNFMHSGYRLASMNNRVSHGEDLRVILAASSGRVLGSIEPREFLIEKHRLEAPVIVSVNREEALCSTGTYASMFFAYTPPRFRFSRPEQAMLQLAVTGMLDVDIARELNLSSATIKKRWENIYDRVADVHPHFFSEAPADVAGQEFAKRGREKRRHVIHYLMRHLEELRPFDWRKQGRLAL
jgi:DNA-binding CsgD family transcriptional regulator